MLNKMKKIVPFVTCETSLCRYVCELMKCRSPTITHMSRTHMVALDWLFDRINLDAKIQIRFFDSFDYHLYHGFIVLKKHLTQHQIGRVSR